MNRTLTPRPWRGGAAGPTRAGDLRSQPPAHANAGLVFARYLSIWSPAEGGGYRVAKTKDRGDALDAFCRVCASSDPQALSEHHLRLDRALPLVPWRELSSISPIAFGLGETHPLENALLFDHSLGVPYLPGSALKGMARAWYRHLAAAGRPAAADPTWGRAHSDDPQAGDLVFYDAHPVTVPKLIIDILNPHHPAYYRSISSGAEQPVAPTDDQDPSPTTFLAVAPGARFRFRVGSRSGDRAAAQRGLELLLDALQVLGIGGKTGVGYGGFEGDALARLARWTPPRVAGLQAVGSLAAQGAEALLRAGFCLEEDGARVTFEAKGRNVRLTLEGGGAFAGTSIADAVAKASPELAATLVGRWASLAAPEAWPAVVVSSYGAQAHPEGPALFALERPAEPGAVREVGEQLDVIVRALQQHRRARSVYLHAPCTPAMGIRAGMAFREVTGLAVKVRQDQSVWLLTEEATGVQPTVTVREHPAAEEVHLLLSVAQDVSAGHAAWLDANPTRATVVELPPQGRISDGPEAVKIARKARRELLSSRRGNVTIRVFAAVPTGLAVALGRTFNALGRVVLMDWDRTTGEYVVAFDGVA